MPTNLISSVLRIISAARVSIWSSLPSISSRYCSRMLLQALLVLSSHLRLLLYCQSLSTHHATIQVQPVNKSSHVNLIEKFYLRFFVFCFILQGLLLLLFNGYLITCQFIPTPQKWVQWLSSWDQFQHEISHRVGCSKTSTQFLCQAICTQRTPKGPK